MVTRNRRFAEDALHSWTPASTHGDLQVAHVFADGDEVTGIIDWSDAYQGDAPFDLVALTLAHKAEHLEDVAASQRVDLDLGQSPTHASDSTTEAVE